MNKIILFLLVFVCLWAVASSATNPTKSECLKNPKKKGCSAVLKAGGSAKPKGKLGNPNGKTAKPRIVKPGGKVTIGKLINQKTTKKPQPKGKTKKSKTIKKPTPKNNNKSDPKKTKKPTPKGKPKKKTTSKNKKPCKRKGGCSKPNTVHPPSGKKTKAPTRKGCPKKRMRGNCRCKYEPKAKVKVTVICQNMNNGTQLARSLRTMAGYKIDSLNLRNIKVGVPPPLFRQMSVKEITMTNCDLQQLTNTKKRPLFSGLERSLNRLSFVGMKKMRVWDWSKLSGMYRLQSVNIMQSDVRSLASDVSRAARGHLTVLALTRTQLKELKPNAFAGQHALNSVWLQGNNLASLQRSMFPKPARKLFSFNLMENKQQMKLPDDLFSKMPVLRSVNLRNNRLTTLSQKMFSPVWNKLTELKVSGNPINCDCKLKWLINAGRKPQVNDLSSTKCSSPARLKGKPLTSLRSADLKC